MGAMKKEEHAMAGHKGKKLLPAKGGSGLKADEHAANADDKKAEHDEAKEMKAVMGAVDDEEKAEGVEEKKEDATLKKDEKKEDGKFKKWMASFIAGLKKDEHKEEHEVKKEEHAVHKHK